MNQWELWKPILHGLAAFVFFIWSLYQFSLIRHPNLRRFSFGLVLLILFLLFKLEVQLFDIKLYLKQLTAN